MKTSHGHYVNRGKLNKMLRYIPDGLILVSVLVSASESTQKHALDLCLDADRRISMYDRVPEKPGTDGNMSSKKHV